MTQWYCKPEGDAVEIITLKVKGMEGEPCKHCVESALLSLDGVSRVEISLESGVAKIHYKPTMVGATLLKTIIEEAGYEVE